MKISIGADHRGFALKQKVIEHFREHQFVDAGTFTDERTDYPLYAKKVCADLLAGRAEAGILICASGVGMSIAANRHKKIYAALCWNREVAVAAKAHDGANVLVLPADFVSVDEALAMVKAWLETPFNGGRYAQRLCMMDE